MRMAQIIEIFRRFLRKLRERKLPAPLCTLLRCAVPVLATASVMLCYRLAAPLFFPDEFGRQDSMPTEQTAGEDARPAAVPPSLPEPDALSLSLLAVYIEQYAADTGLAALSGIAAVLCTRAAQNGQTLPAWLLAQGGVDWTRSASPLSTRAAMDALMGADPSGGADAFCTGGEIPPPSATVTASVDGVTFYRSPYGTG